MQDSPPVAPIDLGPLRANLNAALLGNAAAVDVLVATVVAGGHVLLQDQPGVGKTLLARALARSITGTFGRVQGSPDLLPADVTGITVPDRATGDWVFRPGPIVNNIVLFDELNRSTPRAQSALFEAMAERQVTADGVTRPLPTPFVVVATQNPSEHAGTFPLPEGQLDRFWTATDLALPTPEVERQLVAHAPGYWSAASLQPVCSLEQIQSFQRAVAAIPIAPNVVDYLLGIVGQLRVLTGKPAVPSPRALQILAATSRGYAAIDNASSVTPDHVKAAAVASLAHRCAGSTIDLTLGRQMVHAALDAVSVPTGRAT